MVGPKQFALIGLDAAADETSMKPTRATHPTKMQAVGIVNDHLVDCFRWSELNGVGKRRK